MAFNFFSPCFKRHSAFMIIALWARWHEIVLGLYYFNQVSMIIHSFWNQMIDLKFVGFNRGTAISAMTEAFIVNCCSVNFHNFTFVNKPRSVTLGAYFHNCLHGLTGYLSFDIFAPPIIKRFSKTGIDNNGLARQKFARPAARDTLSWPGKKPRMISIPTVDAIRANLGRVFEPALLCWLSVKIFYLSVWPTIPMLFCGGSFLKTNKSHVRRKIVQPIFRLILAKSKLIYDALQCWIMR